MKEGEGDTLLYIRARNVRVNRGGEKKKIRMCRWGTGNIIEKLAICSGDKSIALMRIVNLRFCSSSPKQTFCMREGYLLELLLIMSSPIASESIFLGKQRFLFITLNCKSNFILTTK